VPVGFGDGVAVTVVLLALVGFCDGAPIVSGVLAFIESGVELKDNTLSAVPVKLGRVGEDSGGKFSHPKRRMDIKHSTKIKAGKRIKPIPCDVEWFILKIFVYNAL
jgi:hypothetical protein